MASAGCLAFTEHSSSRASATSVFLASPYTVAGVAYRTRGFRMAKRPSPQRATALPQPVHRTKLASHREIWRTAPGQVAPLTLRGSAPFPRKAPAPEVRSHRIAIPTTGSSHLHQRLDVSSMPVGLIPPSPPSDSDRIRPNEMTSRHGAPDTQALVAEARQTGEGARSSWPNSSKR